MANTNEKLKHEYRVVVFGEGLVFKIYDGEGREADAPGEGSGVGEPLVEKSMDEVGKSSPFQIIKGGRTEDAVDDRVVSGSKGMLHLVWDSARAAETEESQKPVGNGLLDRVNKFFKRN